MKEYIINAIHSEILKRDVKVYVHLPKNYYETIKSYPVLYMIDGEILFKDYDNYCGPSWGIMENYMKHPISSEVILIGIMSGKTRNDELFPFSFKSRTDDSIIGGNSQMYLQFIVQELKPLIKSKYKILDDSNHTGILGLSVGGACAMYAASMFAKHFTRVACLSTSTMVIKEDLVHHLKNCDYSNIKRLYLDVGTNESGNEGVSTRCVNFNQEIADIFKDKIHKDKFKFQIIEGSKHTEEDWNERLTNVIAYMFGMERMLS